MAQSIQDIMTHDPLALDARTPVLEAAQLMRDSDVGDVLVTENGKVVGILTDRDLVVRLLAEGRDPAQATVGQFASRDLHAVSSQDTVQKAIDIVRDFAVRRIPVIDQGRPVGIISIGDLAIERDPESALAEISAAAPNN